MKWLFLARGVLAHPPQLATHTMMTAEERAELFGSDSESGEAGAEVKPKVAPSPTASDARVDEILKANTSGSSDESEEEDEDDEEEMEDEEGEEEEGEEEEGEEEEEEEEEKLDDGEEEEGGEGGGEEGSEGGGEEGSKEATYSLASLSSEHLESVGAHVCKANAAGFYASNNNIMPVQLPVKVSDESINYMVIGARLVPKPQSVRSRAVAVDERAEIVMGESMVDAAGTRCRLVANVLVHATTAASRTELQQIFGTQSFQNWLAILDHPDHPALVLEPVHTLQNVAPATEAEIKRFRAPLREDASGERQESRGTQWLRLLFEGAVAGSVDGVVAPLLSMKEVGMAAKAAKKQAAKAAMDAARKEKAAAREEKAAKRAAKAAAKAAAPPRLPPRPPPRPSPQPSPRPSPRLPPPPKPEHTARTAPKPMWPAHGLPVGAECNLRPAAASVNLKNRKVTVAVVHASSSTYTVRERSGRTHVVSSERLQLLSLPAQAADGEGRRDDRRNHDRRDDRRDERTPASKLNKAKRSRDSSRDSSGHDSSSSSSSDDSPLSAHQRRRKLAELEAAEHARLRADVERDERKRMKRAEKRKRKREHRREQRREKKRRERDRHY